MSIFVLIHGAWFGAWRWSKVLPRLEQQGHTVVVPDLSSHGREKTPLAAVSLPAYVGPERTTTHPSLHTNGLALTLASPCSHTGAVIFPSPREAGRVRSPLP